MVHEINTPTPWVVIVIREHHDATRVRLLNADCMLDLVRRPLILQALADKGFEAAYSVIRAALHEFTCPAQTNT